MTYHLYLFKDIVFLASKQKEKSSPFKILWVYLLSWFLHLSHYSHLSSYWEASQPSSASRSREEKRRSRECFSTSTAACIRDDYIHPERHKRRPPLPESGNFPLPGFFVPPSFSVFIFSCVYIQQKFSILCIRPFPQTFVEPLRFLETRFFELYVCAPWKIYAFIFNWLLAFGSLFKRKYLISKTTFLRLPGNDREIKTQIPEKDP